MTRLLETGLAQSAKLGWRSLMLLMVSAVVVLPRLRAAEQSPGKDPVSPVPATTPDPKTSDSTERTKPAKPARVDLNIIVAKHVLLLEGKEIITWEWLQNKLAVSPDPSQIFPHFYITRGATEAGLYQPAKDRIWNLHKDFKLDGHSEGSLWPRTDFRYDRIETADDLKPDPALLKTGTVTTNGKPVAGAEVVLITPVDESISYKAYHLALVEGRIRNRLDHVMTVSDESGKYTLYPPKDTPYYVLALHPEAGFSLVYDDSYKTDATLKLMAWSGLVSKLKDDKGEQQVDLTTNIKASDGKPEISINQYWSDRNIEVKDRVFVYHRIPPIYDATVSRSFPSPDGGATSLPAATISLLPGETRTIEFGEITPQQREWLESVRTRFRPAPTPAKPE